MNGFFLLFVEKSLIEPVRWKKGDWIAHKIICPFEIFILRWSPLTFDFAIYSAFSASFNFFRIITRKQIVDENTTDDDRVEY